MLHGVRQSGYYRDFSSISVQVQLWMVHFQGAEFKEESTEMLVLSRGPGEAVTIDDVVEVKILEIRGRTVKLGIDAPCDVNVNRKEVQEAKSVNGTASLPSSKGNGRSKRLQDIRCDAQLCRMERHVYRCSTSDFV
jgi:carbon storage regulator